MLFLLNMCIPVASALFFVMFYGCIWPAFIVNVVWDIPQLIWNAINGHWIDATIDLLAVLVNLVCAFLFWLIERNNRRKKRNLLGLLGYKARAARAKLLAHIPQGRRNPGLSPA